MQKIQRDMSQMLFCGFVSDDKVAILQKKNKIVDEDQKNFFAATFATLKLFIPYIPFSKLSTLLCFNTSTFNKYVTDFMT